MKLLQHTEAPKPWSMNDLFLGESDELAANTAADFFGKISADFQGLDPPSSLDQVKKRIKDIKKSKTRVKGDIARYLVCQFKPLLVEPLHYVISRLYTTFEWPVLWKTETVIIIPKGHSPAGLSKARNISCTPLFSKIAESFLLDDLWE